MFILFSDYGVYDDWSNIALVVSKDKEKLEIIIQDLNKCLLDYFKNYEEEFPKNQLLEELYEEYLADHEKYGEQYFNLEEEKRIWNMDKRFEFVPEHLREYLSGYEEDNLQFYIKEIKEI